MKTPQREQLRRELEALRAQFLDELERDAARLREARTDPDVDAAEVSHDSEELREIAAALRRLDDGTYGTCLDCGAGIDAARLHAEPAAARCVACQARHEKTYRR